MAKEKKIRFFHECLAIYDFLGKWLLKLISNVTFKCIPCCCPRQAKDLFNQFVSGLGKCMSNLLLRMSDVVVMHPRLCSKENFGEPFGLPSISAGVPRPPSWLPELISSLLRSRYENATPNLCWVFCALLGVLCN